MLQLTWFEFFVRLIPESFFVVLAVHAFARQKIEKKRYIIASLFYSVFVFCVRMLPIRYGIHTIIIVVLLITIIHYINEIDVMISIRSSIIAIIILFICEWISIFVLQFMFHFCLESSLENVYLKTIYGLPSFVLLAIIATILYYYRVVKK